MKSSLNMISQYNKKKADKHKVTLDLKSDKGIWFTVKSVSGEEYSVKLSLSCTCEHGSLWGTGKMCSHIVAILKQMLGE